MSYISRNKMMSLDQNIQKNVPQITEIFFLISVFLFNFTLNYDIAPRPS